MRESTIDVGGPVFLVEHDGPADGPVFVLVHGLGGHHANWMTLAPLLARHGRVVVPDLPGFGMTPLAGRDPEVHLQAGFLARLIREHVGGPVVLCGNSMGGMLSLLVAANNPELVEGVVTVSGVLPRPLRAPVDLEVVGAFGAMMIPRAGEWFVQRRRTMRRPERLVAETFELCTRDPSVIPRDVYDRHVAIAYARQSMPWSNEAFLRAARTIVRMITGRRRYRQIIERVAAPVLAVAGTHDRLVPVECARQLARSRGWKLAELPHCSHIPMLEDPRGVATEIAAWLEAVRSEATA